MSRVGSGSKVSKTSKRSGGVTLDGNRDTTLGLVDDAIGTYTTNTCLFVMATTSSAHPSVLSFDL